MAGAAKSRPGQLSFPPPTVIPAKAGIQESRGVTRPA